MQLATCSKHIFLANIIHFRGAPGKYRAGGGIIEKYVDSVKLY